MHSHERYEEHKLYPFLEHRWGVDCDPLRAGHSELSQADAHVREAESAMELVKTLRAHERILIDPLDKEEILVIPALLARPPHEFAFYSRRPLSRALREVPCHAGSSGCRACAPR